jgi:hypothetical protein
VINELRRIFKDQPFDVTDVWQRGNNQDAALAAAIDAAVPQARYKHGTLKWVPIKEARVSSKWSVPKSALAGH